MMNSIHLVFLAALLEGFGIFLVLVALVLFIRLVYLLVFLTLFVPHLEDCVPPIHPTVLVLYIHTFLSDMQFSCL